MTAIDPLNSMTTARRTSDAVKPPDASDQFGKDTFLKLLVAQLRFQNPLSPSDPTEFLSQTAQFTMVEKLQEIEEQTKNQTATNEVLAAATMIGRSVTFAIGTDETAEPVATTKLSVGGSLPSDAAPGTKHDAQIDIFDATGKKVPLRLQFTKLPNGHDWEVRALEGTRQFHGPLTLTFDASGELTSGALVIPSSALDTIEGTSGRWAASGLTLGFGAAGDTARLRLGSGGATVGVREQNGSNGLALTGVVTGVRFDVTGPMLQVGGREIPMSAVTEVHVPAQ